MDRPVPRHGFLRFFAFATDFAIVCTVVALIVAVAGWDDYDKRLDAPERSIVFGFNIGTETCGRPRFPIENFEARVAPARATEAQICIRAASV